MANKQMTADEILEAIQKMSNEERWKLLDKMYDLYYSKEHLIIKAKRKYLEEDDY
ncbi:MULTISPECIES: hypothetical protein [Bacillaceae]|jgi:uncharacterized protein YacL (UPF0231 family)|uniref:Uncharacterized protein YacL (UPF0231 family) n=3 Tax=Anoxybacillaceae TaxID=3120669 RepID=A0A6G9IZ96_9BACL|nr:MULTISPECIES: hypothetical protein [Bacillaceae]AKM18334.1 hypothetical protein GARCT_01040 [Geobacillus sp. 12AMOR1]MED5072717.1 hypothetical protein [Anoxybacillus geothermalis]QNU35402.1 hypothetical protein IC802_05580 [Geobacillus sp. 44C]STO11534.1 Uncharacterised protein [[Flavobacterium] thermophilum]ARP41989.1 hypothetical protein GTHT12_00427 [Geobacillus thermodenitrificans]